MSPLVAPPATVFVEPVASIVTSVPPSTLISSIPKAASLTVTVPAAPVVPPIVVVVPVAATVTLTFSPPLTATVPVTPETFTSVVAAAVKVAEVLALVTFKVSTPVYVVVLNPTVSPLFKLIVSMLEIFAVTVAIAPSVCIFK